MRYRLQHYDRVPEMPAWWNVGGMAFESCVVEWESTRDKPTPDNQAERFAMHFDLYTQLHISMRPDIPVTAWRAARGREDGQWWHDNGPEMVAKYVTAQLGREYELLAFPDELTFDHPMLTTGLRAIPDQVLWYPGAKHLVIQDLKAGSTIPNDDLQLKIYRLALNDWVTNTMRLAPTNSIRWFGQFWSARKGQAVGTVELTDLPHVLDEVAFRVNVMDAAERAGLYPPNPGNFCSSCPVKVACPVKGDHRLRRPWTLDGLVTNQVP